MRPDAVMWTIEEVRPLILELEKRCKQAGWHFALTGGLLRKSYSTHDVDIIAYPHCSVVANRKALRRVLREDFGWHLRMKAWELHRYWKRKGGFDRKHVEVWKTRDGRRVDLFIMGDR